ncbi:flagellar basal body P-ring formation chaperone FlgA [Balneolales bacterium ANBcel1]|nr:flagellar basal body P-ring formation chaperone FlgA [Balneolales bacterium ANBcel1]
MKVIALISVLVFMAAGPEGMVWAEGDGNMASAAEMSGTAGTAETADAMDRSVDSRSGAQVARNSENSTAGRYPAREKILELAGASLEAAHDPQNYRFDVTARWIPGSLAQLPAESIMAVVPDGAVERYTGFEVTYETDGRRRRAQVQLQVDIERWLPVMSERVSAGDVIGSENMTMRWVPVPRDRGQLVADPAAIEGMTVRRTLTQGEPVRQADISTEYIVETGETVTLILQRDGVRVDISAVARQNGSRDESIRLYSDETRRTYLGRVTGPGYVQWVRTL